jgi:hypothetical protein
MGGVSMRSVLRVTACTNGLRVQIFRLFGPFSRPFFVPWEDITVIRKTTFFQPRVDLLCGSPEVGRVTIEASAADKLARASFGLWPEATLPPEETPSSLVQGLAVKWLVLVVLGDAMLAAIPNIAPSRTHIPVELMLFPPAVFGLCFMFEYYYEQTSRKRG